jgi:undecaprenyl-phosphate galactose phosphotransferase
MYTIIKRLLDILISLIGIVFLIILTIIFRILFFLTGDFHKLFYTQERIGKDGKKFKIFKYRTMCINSEEVLKDLLKDPKIKKEWDEHYKLDNDPRITKVGRLLRKTSLDEIPQVLNILIGDMSLIGPRPLTLGEVLEYKKDKDLLLSVRPGLTGWWGVNGRSNTAKKDRMKLELYYCKNISFKLDVKIFFMTFYKVLKSDGAQ